MLEIAGEICLNITKLFDFMDVTMTIASPKQYQVSQKKPINSLHPYG